MFSRKAWVPFVMKGAHFTLLQNIYERAAFLLFCFLFLFLLVEDAAILARGTVPSVVEALSGC